MKIQINGKDQDLPENTSLKTAIQNIRPDCQRVIAELNGQIVKRDVWEETSLSNGDSLELVSFVGGG